MKYFWKCIECGFEHHNKIVHTNPQKTVVRSHFPVKCPMCDEEAFYVVEKDPASQEKD